MIRIELLERYSTDKYSDEWWEDNMPKGSIRNSSYSYRRTMPLVEMIERPIEIVGNKDEFIVRFWGGEDIVCKGDFDEFCILLNDIEENMFEDDAQ